MKKIKEYFPYLLLLFYIGLLIRSGINPVDRGVWYAEEWTVFVVVLFLVFTFKKFRFSNFSYLMMFAWIVIHTIWGHYTFENVPFDWFNDLFGFERNMYDRFGHFIIWFYAFPIIEFLDRKNMVNNKIKQCFIIKVSFMCLNVIFRNHIQSKSNWWFISFLQCHLLHFAIRTHPERIKNTPIQRSKGICSWKNKMAANIPIT